MIRWIFLGDDSRWQFVCWLLKISLKDLPGNGQKTILIKHDSVKYNLQEEESALILSTYNMLPDMEAFIPAYGENLQLSLEKFDKCALFETHPLGRESTENLANLLESGRNEPMMLFVLMDLLDDIDYEPLIDAKNRMSTLIKKGRDVLIARSETDVLEILHWHRPLVTDLRRRIQHELKAIRNQIKLCPEYYAAYIENWKIAGCLNPAVKAKITGFEVVKGHPHIWKCYNEAAQKVLFPNTKNLKAGIYEAIDLYRKILYNPNEQGKNLAAFIWNVEVDLMQLLEKLRSRFDQYMTSPKKYHNFLNNDESNSEHIYLSLVDRPGGRFYGIKNDFLNRYEQFVCVEVLETVKNELEEHIDKLRGMIK